MIESSVHSSLDTFFESKTNSSPEVSGKNFIGLVKEDKIVNPFATDAFQENILKAVKQGLSVVVQGPPGTGKSQLICNLLADAMANKKNVLVVCQKRAALDVVFTRMQKAGFSEFVTLVHDFKNDRKEIYSRIANQIDKVNDYKVRVNSLDAIQLDRNFHQACKQIDLTVEELEHFKESLFDGTECGISIKELYLSTDHKAEKIINVKQEYSSFPMNGLTEIASKVRSLGMYADILEKEFNPWRNRKPFAKLPPSALPEIKSILLHIPETLQTISDRVKGLTGSALDYYQAEIFSKRLDDLKLLKSVLENEVVYKYLGFMADQKKGATDILWIQNMQRVIDEMFKMGPEISVETASLGKFQQSLNRSIKARRNFITLIRWELFSEDKYLIKRALVSNNLSDREGLKALEKKLDVRLNLEHNLTKLRSIEWIKEMPQEYDRQKFEAWFNDVVLAARCNNLFDEIRNSKNFLSPHAASHQQFQECIKGLIECLEIFIAGQERWSVYLSTRQMEELGMDFSKGPGLTRYVQNYFDTMCEYDDLMEALSPNEKEIFQKLTDATDFKLGSEELNRILTNSLGLSWIDHIESKHPELRMVSSGKLTQLETTLQENIAEKAALCKEMALLRARERVIESLEFNRLKNLISYRDLNHEVTKKKKAWPLRKLIDQFSEELFRLQPIWLASPEAASALFPQQELFDLVIFDEASQCFSERGLPAIARAKQVVVAGDHQQLKPGDFFRSRFEEESEDPDMEVESLLELASRHWLTLTLQGHYRSQSIELVQFSNQHFYSNKLELLPHRQRVNSKDKPLEFIKVDGIWEEQTNLEEAQKISELVYDITRQFPDKEIGVITFNQPQQMLVLDKLEEKFRQFGLSLPKSLMVKNIENVQGDEKDIIIFSIGYARDGKGRLTLQFGSLNIAGGENRLNVAITRSREKIIVVSSILPEELDTDSVKNNGPKLLKEYLSYAIRVSTFDPKKDRHDNKSKFDWYLKYKLSLPEKQTLYDFFPHADIVVNKEGQFGPIILTDDNFYEQTLSAKHHHALLPKLLEEKDWQYTTLYSRNYWLDPKKVALDLERYWD
jgi:RecA/RadA recombinase